MQQQQQQLQRHCIKDMIIKAFYDGFDVKHCATWKVVLKHKRNSPRTRVVITMAYMFEAAVKPSLGESEIIKISRVITAVST